MISEKPSSTEVIEESAHHERKYAKITDGLKQIFIRKIVIDNLSIKQASELLRINYSSAKAIISVHRKENIFRKRKAPKRHAPITGYRTIQGESSSACIT